MIERLDDMQQRATDQNQDAASINEVQTTNWAAGRPEGDL